MLGIGFGTLLAHRLWKHLWLIELCIGLYGAAFALGAGQIDTFLYDTFPSIGSNISTVLLTASVLLAIPAFLIGCSVPLFAGYLAQVRRERAFSRTYFLYNLGAATTAILIEFVLIRAVGLRGATLLIAALNGVVAVALRIFYADLRGLRAAPERRVDLPARIVVALVLSGIASAVFQLLLIKCAEFLFGPYNETFALVLALVLGGIALASVLVTRLDISFGQVLTLCVTSLAIFLGVFTPAAELFARLNSQAAEGYWTFILLKGLVLLLIAGFPAVAFGATVPALLRTDHEIARISGRILFWSSMGNAAGFLLMTLQLHQRFDYGSIAFISAAIVGLGLFIYIGASWPRRAAVGALVLGVFVIQQTAWNENLLDLGYRSFVSLEELDENRRERRHAERFKSAEDTVTITWIGEVPYLYINGYRSLRLPSFTEALVGAYGAMLAPRTDRALVLGIGAGTTAGTVGLLFDETVAVDVNSALIDNLDRMREYNFDLQAMESVRLVHDDGIHFLKTQSTTYSLILNTVTTPIYFSASKLYTLDFFEDVRRHLTPDGVYLTWLDTRTGDEGVDIVLATLDEVFESCWIITLTPGYFLVACGLEQVTLAPRNPVEGQPEITRFLMNQRRLRPELLPYGVISTRGLDLRGSNDVPLNTLDYPVLEFSIARLSRFKGVEKFRRRLIEGLDIADLRSHISAVAPWKPENLLLHYRFLVRGRPFAEIWDQAVREELGDAFDATYAQALQAHMEIYAQEAGAAAAHLVAGRFNLSGRRFEEALASFYLALEEDPKLEGAHAGAGRVFMGLRRYEDAIPHLEAEWQTHHDESVAKPLGVAYLRTRRPAIAALWLERALRHTPDIPDINLALGIAYKASGKPKAARRAVSRELALRPNHAGARATLRRWAAQE
jgi:predicted membrane-bound spermidine synthase